MSIDPRTAAIQLQTEFSQNKHWQDLHKSRRFDIVQALVSIAYMNDTRRKALKPKNFESVFSIPSPSLVGLGKYFGEVVVKAFLHDELQRLRFFFSVGRGLTDEAIEELCELIIEEYYFFNLSDVKLVFKKAKKGNFGKSYDRVDGQIILEWFSAYNELRLSASERFEEQKRKERENQEAKETKSFNSKSFDLLKKLNKSMEETIRKERLEKNRFYKKYSMLEEYLKDAGFDINETLSVLEDFWRKEFCLRKGLITISQDVEGWEYFLNFKYNSILSLVNNHGQMFSVLKCDTNTEKMRKRWV